MHAWGLRLRRVRRLLALTPPPVLPSAMRNDVGTPVAIISQLNTLPACAPVNASMAASRLATHDSGPGWIATPFLYDSFIHYFTPVYPDAIQAWTPAPPALAPENVQTSGLTPAEPQTKLAGFCFVCGRDRYSDAPRSFTVAARKLPLRHVLQA